MKSENSPSDWIKDGGNVRFQNSNSRVGPVYGGQVKPLIDWTHSYGKALPFEGEGNFISFTALGEPPLSMEDSQAIATMPTEWLPNMGEPPHDEWTLDDVLDRLLDRLHAELIAFPEKIEVRGLIPFVINEDALDASQVSRGPGRGGCSFPAAPRQTPVRQTPPASVTLRRDASRL